MQRQLTSAYKLNDAIINFFTNFSAHEKTKNVDDEFEKKKLLFTVRRRQRVASQKLAEFIQCDVHYTFRRILAAENSKLYKGCIDGLL